jgi:hypothetical protein
MGNFLSGEPQDSAQPIFWSTRYASERTPWQLDHLPRQLKSFIDALPPNRKILIPGCGNDTRAIRAFRGAGHSVAAIDFSSVAVEKARATLPDAGDIVLLGDFFDHKFEPSSFDLIYERTFLCSLPPRLWEKYADRVAQLLRPGGKLTGFFFYGHEPDPPPYRLTRAKAAELFGARFNLLKDEPVQDSPPIFAGAERWQEWQLRP